MIRHFNDFFSELKHLHGKRRSSHVSIHLNHNRVCPEAVVVQLKDRPPIRLHSVLHVCSSGKSSEGCPDAEVAVVSFHEFFFFFFSVSCKMYDSLH